MESGVNIELFKTTTLIPFLFMRLSLLIFPLLISTALYKNYLNIRWGKALLLALFTTAAAVGVCIASIYAYESRHMMANWKHIFPNCLLVYFLIPLAIQLYRKWIGNQMTEQERTPGAEGYRAWLSVGNLICVFGIIFCQWMRIDFHLDPPTLLSLALPFLLLLIYPAINTLHYSRNSGKSCNEELSVAQIKILKLLEDGKITSQECAELLDALRGTKSEPDSVPPPPPSGS